MVFLRLTLGHIVCLFLIGIFLTVVRYAPTNLNGFVYVWLAGLQGGLIFGLMAVLLGLVIAYFFRDP